jgi:hypothetical protein
MLTDVIFAQLQFEEKHLRAKIKGWASRTHVWDSSRSIG